MANKRHITLADIKGTPIYEKNKHLFDAPREKPKIVLPKPVSKEKSWLSWNLSYWCNERALTLETEYQFFEYRKWRSDWHIPALKILIEYNGLFSEKSRHTTVTGYTGDMEKINKAAELGFTVLSYTPLNYKNVLSDLTRIYNKLKQS